MQVARFEGIQYYLVGGSRVYSVVAMFIDGVVRRVQVGVGDLLVDYCYDRGIGEQLTVLVGASVLLNTSSPQAIDDFFSSLSSLLSASVVIAEEELPAPPIAEVVGRRENVKFGPTYIY